MSGASLAPLPTPSVLGRYELRAVLGRGGSGVVYDAVQVGLVGFRKRVALKVLASDDASDESGRVALQREARLGAHLSHPNVVGILDLGRDLDRWYIAMELVDGVPVSSLVSAGVIDAAALVEVGIAACAGLTHIHDLRIDGAPGGLVHRDLKPQNLLVDRNGTVKIADFGISALSTTTGDLSGSPPWMAPEQQRGEVSPAVDLFSLGAVLFALATRRYPFGRGAVALRQVQHVEAMLEDPTFLAPVDAVVPGLGAIVRRCLRLRPEDRYPSAAAVAADLRALRATAGVGDLGALVRKVAQTEPSEPPSATAQPTSLAKERPTLIGRGRELGAVCSAYRSGGREVAIVGLGGIGKTRLAEAVAAELAVQGRTVVWVELGLDRPDDPTLGVARAVARALGVQLTQTDPLAQLDAALAARPDALVVLDGAEAADLAIATLTARWAAAAPRSWVLLTSRTTPRGRPLAVVALDGLPPDDAIALFTARSPSNLTAEDRAALPGLVEALDHLPLAIELAAARTRALPVPRILQRMRDRFRLLVDPARPGTSLRSSLGTSFALLRPWEARALGELSVFAGSFTLEAAEAVMALQEWPEAPWALDVLSELLDASLVRHDRATGRFSLLHSVRDYAAETLEAGQLRAAEVRHGEHFSQLAATLQSEQRQPGTRARLEAELAELQVASERALARGDGHVVESTAGTAASVYLDRGPYAVGAALLDRALALPGGRQRVRLLQLRAQLRRVLGRHAEAEADLDEASRSLDEVPLGLRLSLRCMCTLRESAARAIELLTEIATDAAAKGEYAAEARAWSMASLRYYVLEDLDAARRCLERARQRFDAIGEVSGSALAAMRLGRIHVKEGRLGDATGYFDAAESGFRAVHDSGNAATTVENRSVALLFGGDREGAERGFLEVLRWARLAGNRLQEVSVVLNLGNLACWNGRTDTARAWVDEGLVLARSTRVREHEAWAFELQGVVARLLGQTDTVRDRLESSAAIYRQLGLAARAQVVEAMLWVERVEHGTGEPQLATQVLGPIAAHAASPLWLRLGHALVDQGDLEGAARASSTLHAQRAERPPPLPFARACDVLAARMAIHHGHLEQAARLLDHADRHVIEEEQRVRAHVARVEYWRRAGDAARALRAHAALGRAVDRAGFAPGTPLHRLAAALA
jgi:non-specific serine/threonine protein kinase